MKPLIVLLTIILMLFSNSIAGDKHNSSLKEILTQEVKSYIQNHGETLTDTLFTPYAAEYCDIEKINPSKIVNKLFGDISTDSPPDVLPNYISSYRYLCGNWTYFMSNSVCIYEILKIKDTLTNQIYIIVLHNSPLIENEPLRLKGWHISIFSDQLDLIQSINLENKSPFRFLTDEDMVYTDLEIENGNILAVITYTFTGSGGAPERGYSFEVSLSGNVAKLVKTTPIKDGDRRKRWYH